MIEFNMINLFHIYCSIDNLQGQDISKENDIDKEKIKLIGNIFQIQDFVNKKDQYISISVLCIIYFIYKYRTILPQTIYKVVFYGNLHVKTIYLNFLNNKVYTPITNKARTYQSSIQYSFRYGELLFFLWISILLTSIRLFILNQNYIYDIKKIDIKHFLHHILITFLIIYFFEFVWEYVFILIDIIPKFLDDSRRVIVCGEKEFNEFKTNKLSILIFLVNLLLLKWYINHQKFLIFLVILCILSRMFIMPFLTRAIEKTSVQNFVWYNDRLPEITQNLLY